LFDLFHKSRTTESRFGLVVVAPKVLRIGVLKVLEEAGLKIDYIGGTSMGSVVGMYA
jgi:hypothetical protein